MKKITPIVILLIIICSCNQKESNLRSDYNKYITALNNGNYEISTEMVPNELYKDVSKEKVIEQLKWARDNYGAMNIDSLQIFKINKIEEENNILYTKIDYKAIVILNLLESKKHRAKKLIDSFKLKYKNGTVAYDSVNLIIKIYTNSHSYCISKDKGKSWKFLENVDNTEFINLVPEEILQSYD